MSKLSLFAKRPGFRAAAHNFSWLGLDRAVKVFLGFGVGFWTTRYLGPAQFGALNYALALVGLLLPVAEMGLDAVIRRELIKYPEKVPLLVSVTVTMRGLAAIFCYLTVGMIAAFGTKNQTEQKLLLILGFMVFSPAGMAADLWLHANLKARASVIGQWISLGAIAALRIALVFSKASLFAFAWACVTEVIMTAVVAWVIAHREGLRARWIMPDRKSLYQMVLPSIPLLLSGLTVALYMRIDLVMLKSFRGEYEAGIYAAAVRLSEMAYFIPAALAASALPALLRSRSEGPFLYFQRLQQFYDLNAFLAYCFAVIATIIAPWIVAFAYGSQFVEAGPVLKWHAWAGIFVFLGVARAQFLVNENLGMFSLVATGVGALVNVALNVWLIPRSGALGAAQATLISYAVAAWFSSWCHPRVRMNALMQGYALLIPFRCRQYFSRLT